MGRRTAIAVAVAALVVLSAGLVVLANGSLFGESAPTPPATATTPASATTAPPGSTTTTPPPEIPCTGVPVQPGTDTIAHAAGSAGAGTTFCVSPGHYLLTQPVTVHNGQHFIARGSPPPILDGAASVATAFSGKGASDVWIVGFDMTNFRSSQTYQPPGVVDGTGGSGWLVSENEIHNNSNTGIKFYGAGLHDRTSGIDNSTVSYNYIHDNGYSGSAVSSSSDLVFQANEIARNNLSGADKADDVAALGKFAATARVALKNNFVHDNNSIGIWFDVDSIAADVENNRVLHNAEGVVYEISFDATIANNTIDANGLSFRGNIYQGGAGIRISSAGGQASGVIDISGNQLHGNYQGITVYQQARGESEFGSWVTRNVEVHDNLISGSTWVSSALAEDAKIGPGIFNNGNTFDHNQYALLKPTSPFQYRDLTTWTGWRRHEDASGSCSLIAGGKCR